MGVSLPPNYARNWHLPSTSGRMSSRCKAAKAGGSRSRRRLEALTRLCWSSPSRALLSQIVRREWVYARRLGKQIVPVVRDASLLAGAPRWLQRSHVYILDPNNPDYAQLHRAFLNQLQHPKPQPPVLNQTPPLPDTFVARPKLQDLILDRLIGANRDEPSIGVTTLLGAGGFGKTTLVQVIGGDPDITDAFSGGVYYVTVGESELTLTQDLNAILRDLKLPEATPEQAAAKVREALAERECLLIFDDVWKTVSVGLLRSLPAGHVLITTREPSVAALSTGKPIAIEEMESKEAAAMLIKYLPRDIEPTADDESALRRLAGRLGEWPLLLNIFGKVLSEEVIVRKSTLKAALAYVSEGLDIEGLAVFGRDDAGRNAALDASMAVSLRGFSDAESTRLYELAVFPDDGMVSELTALTLWHGTGRLSNFEGKKLLRRLSGGFTTPEPNGAFRIHDKLKEYLGSKLGREALRDAQVKLIDAWGDLRTLPDDYAWRNIAYHLIEAGKPEALHALLLDYAFLQAKLNATNISALVTDCERLSGDETIRLLHSALTMSAHILANDHTALVHQLHGRLYSQREQAGIDILRAQTAPPALMPLNEPTHAQAGGSLLRTLTGHTNAVGGALELHDGRLLSWSDDTTLRLWAADGSDLAVLEGHTEAVSSALELHDKRLLSWSGNLFKSSPDTTLRLWDASGLTLAVLEGHTNWVSGALELHDRRLLSWSWDKTLRLWDADGCALVVLQGHTDGVRGALELHDGHLLSWSWDKTLRLWDADGRALATLVGHTEEMWGALALRDGRLLSWSKDTTLRLWTTDGRALAVLEGHRDGVSGARLLADGRLLSWSDNTLRLWDADGCAIVVLEGHTSRIMGVLELADGRLLSWSLDWTLRLWSKDWHTYVVLKGHTWIVIGALALGDGYLLSWSGDTIGTSSDNTLRLWDTNGRAIAILEGHNSSVRGALALANGRILSWSKDRTLRLWDTNGRGLATLDGHNNSVVGALELANGGLLSWSKDGTLHLWSTDGHTRAVFHGHTHWIYGVLALANGRLLSWSFDGTLRLWGADGRALSVLEGHTEVILGARELMDGRRLVTWSGDKTLRLWNANGSPLTTFEGHTDWVMGVQELADGRLLSCSDDGTLRLWAADGRALAVLEGHTERVFGALELADERLLSWSADKTLRLWAADGRFIDVIDEDADPTLLRAWFARHNADWDTYAAQHYISSPEYEFFARTIENVLQVHRFAIGDTLARFYAESRINTAVFLQHSNIIALGCENGQVIFLKVTE